MKPVESPRAWAQAQACAAGALLNVLGPLLEAAPGGAAPLRALGRVMTAVLVLASVQTCLNGPAPCPA